MEDIKKDIYFKGFDASSIGNKSFENFAKSIGDINKTENTPPQIQEIRDSYTQKDPIKQFQGKLNELGAPNTGYMYGTPVETFKKPSLEQKNYNVDELYSTLSTGEKVANFPTYTPGIDNYEAFAQSQSNWDKWVNGGTKFLSQVLTGVVGGTAGTVYGIVNGIKEGSFAATYDNDFMNYLDNINEKLRYSNPNYIKKAEKDLSFIEKMGTANFWADEFLGGLAFTASAIGTELTWAWATAGVGTAVRGARLGVSLTDDLIRAGAVARAEATVPLRNMTNRSLLNINKAINYGKIGEAANLVRSIYTGAGYEAGFEARSYKREMREKFEKEWLKLNGTEPTEQDRLNFENKLESSANGLFAYNLAIVGSSNVAMFGGLVGLKVPFVGGIKKWTNKRIFGSGVIDGKAIKPTKFQKALQYGFLTGKGAIVEGVWEEGMQAVGKNTAKTLLESGYSSEFANESYSLSKAFGKGFEETYGTKEGLEEVYLGMLIGAFSGNVMHLAQTGSINAFNRENTISQIIEENFGENATYSSRVAVENMLMSNRVIASKKAEKNAEREGDLLGGQISRNNSIFAQMNRASNLDYLDEVVESTLQEIDLIDENLLAKENKLTLEQAQELKASMKEEYRLQAERFEKIRDFSRYFIGNKFSKEEKQIIEEHYINNNYSQEEAKKVTSDVLQQALTYELFMGEVSHNFSEEILEAFQNEVQNLLGSTRIKSTFAINDVLNKSSLSTRRKLSKTKKELEASIKEFEKLEKEYRQVENIMTRANSVEERSSIQSRLSNLLLKKEELIKKKELLANEFNTLFNSAKLENPYGRDNSTEILSEEEIINLEKQLKNTFDSIEALKNTDPQKAETLSKLFKEYEKSVAAFKKYSERTSQITNPEIGLRGKRNIISEILKSKTPKQATIDMIKGLVDTHFEIDRAVEENKTRIEQVVEEVKQQSEAINMQAQESIEDIEQQRQQELSEVDITEQLENLSDDLLYITHITNDNNAVNIFNSNLRMPAGVSSTTGIVTKAELVKLVNELIKGNSPHRGYLDLFIAAIDKATLQNQIGKTLFDKLESYLDDNFTEDVAKAQLPSSFNIGYYSNKVLNIKGTTNKVAEINKKYDDKIRELKDKTVNFSVKSYIIEQIKNHPYLYNQIGEEYDEALPTEEEINRYADLFEKDLIEQQPLTTQELEEFNELNIKMANWQLLEAVMGEGVSIADMIKQDVLNKQNQLEETLEEISEEDTDKIIKNGEVEDNTPRPFSILQTVQNVFLRKKKAGYYFSHITPKSYFEKIGQTDVLEYQDYNEKGEPISELMKISVEDVNDIVKPHTKIFYGNTNITITKGLGIKVPTTAFESEYFKTRNTNSGYMMVFDSDGSPMKSDFVDVDTYSPAEIYRLTNRDILTLRIDKNDPYNQSLSKDEIEDNIKISAYDTQGNKVADLKASYLAEGQQADEMFLSIRNKAKQLFDASDEDIIEIGDIEVQNVFLGAPNIKLDESNKEEQFTIPTDQVFGYGIWSDNRLKLTEKINNVRTDLLKGINKTVPIIVVKEGETLIAYPVSLTKVASNLGQTILETSVSDSDLAIRLNEALLKNNKKTVELYYLSVDNQNMRNEDGTPTDILNRAIEEVNNIQNKVDFKNTWFTKEHTKEDLVKEATVNINLEGEKFLSPKIAINLDSFNEYVQPDDVLTEEQITTTIENYRKLKEKIGSYRLYWSDNKTVEVGESSRFHPIKGSYNVIVHPVSKDTVFISNISERNKNFYNRLLGLSENELQNEIDNILRQKIGNFAKTKEEMEKYYSNLSNLVAIEKQIEENPKLKKRLTQEKEKRFSKYEEAQNNKKC